MYEHWADPIYRWVLTRTGGVHHTTEDVCQDVWLRVARGIRRYVQESGTGGFIGWLFTIARNRLADLGRAASRRREVLSADMLAVPDAVTSPGPGEFDTPLDGDLHTALSKLSAKRAEVVTLRFFVGLSVEEAATVIGTTPGGVRSLQCRALSDLRALMGPMTVTDEPTLSQTHPSPRGANAC